MNQFKIGDRVRLAADPESHGTITSLREDVAIVRYDAGYTGPVFTARIRSIPAPPPFTAAERERCAICNQPRWIHDRALLRPAHDFKPL